MAPGPWFEFMIPNAFRGGVGGSNATMNDFARQYDLTSLEHVA